jgi:hypothetical protein
LRSEILTLIVALSHPDCRATRYLATIEVVPEDALPFDRLGLKAKRVSWLQFEPAEVVKLLSGAIDRGDAQFADMIRQGMYSGARREGNCSPGPGQNPSGSFG